MAEGGSVMLLTKSVPFVTSICTPVLGLDWSNWYVQLREMVVVVLELTSRVDMGSGSSVTEAIEREIIHFILTTSYSSKIMDVIIRGGVCGWGEFNQEHIIIIIIG